MDDDRLAAMVKLASEAKFERLSPPGCIWSSLRGAKFLVGEGADPKLIYVSVEEDEWITYADYLEATEEA